MPVTLSSARDTTPRPGASLLIAHDEEGQTLLLMRDIEEMGLHVPARPSTVVSNAKLRDVLDDETTRDLGELVMLVTTDAVAEANTDLGPVGDSPVEFVARALGVSSDFLTDGTNGEHDETAEHTVDDIDVAAVISYTPLSLTRPLPGQTLVIDAGGAWWVVADAAFTRTSEATHIRHVPTSSLCTDADAEGTTYLVSYEEFAGNAGAYVDEATAAWSVSQALPVLTDRASAYAAAAYDDEGVVTMAEVAREVGLRPQAFVAVLLASGHLLPAQSSSTTWRVGSAHLRLHPQRAGQWVPVFHDRDRAEKVVAELTLIGLLPPRD